MSSSKSSPACSLSSCLLSNDLLKWGDQKKSGAVFTTGLFTLYLLRNYTLLGLLAYTLLYTTMVCSSWVLIKNVIVAFQANQNSGPAQTNPHPFQKILDFIPLKANFKEDKIAQLAKKLTSALNRAINMAGDLVLAKSIWNSTVFGLGLYMTSGILARFEFLSLCWYFWVMAFTVPFGYSMKKNEIDGVLVKIWEPIEPHYIKMTSMAMKYKNASSKLAESQEKDE